MNSVSEKGNIDLKVSSFGLESQNKKKEVRKRKQKPENVQNEGETTNSVNTNMLMNMGMESGVSNRSNDKNKLCSIDKLKYRMNSHLTNFEQNGNNSSNMNGEAYSVDK